MVYQIIEVANTHQGDLDYLVEVVNTFSSYTNGYGIKFQPINPDTIATTSFPYYSLYQQLHFTSEQWQDVISLASATKDVWLDLFDVYGVQILCENIKRVHGIKFQTSVLFNYTLMGALAELDLSDKKLIVNVAAQPLDDIAAIIERLEVQLKPQEILIEVGFQAYPTALEDAGICKIGILKERFTNRIVFADHAAGESSDALNLPIAAVMSGASVIEKHVMLSTRPTEIDNKSSLIPERFAELTQNLINYSNLLSAPFINGKEVEYLEKSIMVPVLKEAKLKGSGLNIKVDFEFKRSGKTGLNAKQIDELVAEGYILGVSKNAGDTLAIEDFQKASIGCMVACRMKSTRLPKKAILKIGNLSSIELSLKNVLNFKNINSVILGTSTTEEDAILKDYTYNERVRFFQGNPEDVIQRVLDASDSYKFDIFVRITGDCPFHSDVVLQTILTSHLQQGADYSVGRVAPLGANIEVINIAALRKVKAYIPVADYSEYMTYYFTNNADIFRLNVVELPELYHRNYRLTLDYEEDIVLFRRLYDELSKLGKTLTLENIIEFLDVNPEIAAINQGMEVKYFTDKELINRIYSHTKINK